MPVDVFCAAVSGRAGSFSPAGRIVMVSFVTIFQRKKWRGKGQRLRQFSQPGHVFLRRYESDQVRRHYLNCINRAVHLTLLSIRILASFFVSQPRQSCESTTTIFQTCQFSALLPDQLRIRDDFEMTSDRHTSNVAVIPAVGFKRLRNGVRLIQDLVYEKCT